jgi:dolichol kinase
MSTLREIQKRPASAPPVSNPTTIQVGGDPERLEFRPLTSRELKRRLWHMAPGCLPFLLQWFPHRDPVSPTLRWIIVGCCVLIGGRILMGFRQIQRRGEGAGLAAVSGYALSVLLMAVAFPADLELSLAVLSILAFGDGSATLCGLTFRGPRLPWNRGKSWSGLIAFIGVGCVMTAWIYRGETHNPEALTAGVSFGIALALTAPAVIAAAIAESIPSRINDNIRVGLVAAVSLILLHTLR